MANLGTYIAGGLLQGLGTGLTQQGIETGRAKRDRALLELRQQHDVGMAERRESHDVTMAERKEGFETGLLRQRQTGDIALEERRQAGDVELERMRGGRERGLLSAEQDFETRQAELEREHETGVERIKAKGKKEEDRGLGSVEGNRAYEAVKEAHTETNQDGVETTNWRAVANDSNLKARYPEYAQLARSTADRIERAQAEGDARTQAEAELEGELGSIVPFMGRSPSEDEIQARTQQILARSGKAAPTRSPSETIEAGEQPAPRPDTRSREAMESRNLPRPTTEAEYNALRSGARFIDPQGQIRVKP